MRIYRHYYNDDDDHDGSGQIAMTTNLRNNPGYVAVSMIPTPLYQTSLQQQQQEESLHGHHAEEEEVKIELNVEIENREKRNRNKRGNSSVVMIPSSYQNLRSSKNSHRGGLSYHDGEGQHGDGSNDEMLNYGSTQAINSRTYNTLTTSSNNKEQDKSILSSLWFLPSLRKIAMDKINGLLSRTSGVGGERSIHSKVSSTYASSSSSSSTSDINMTTTISDIDDRRMITRKGSLNDRIVRESTTTTTKLSSESNNHMTIIGL